MTVSGVLVPDLAPLLVLLFLTNRNKVANIIIRTQKMVESRFSALGSVAIDGLNGLDTIG